MVATTPSTCVIVQTLVRDGRGTWSIDPADSAANFHVNRFCGVITVHGHFEQIEGAGTVDEAGNMSGEVDIDAGSLTTKNAKRDLRLRSPEFFDFEHHPTGPLKMASSETRAVVNARFVRS
jgi:polyisoprenoid-binding protein YceI